MPSHKLMSQHDPFVKDLMEALGLPHATVSFDVRCAVGEAVTVRCTYHPRADDGAGFDPRPLLQTYQLVPISAVTRGDPAEAFVDDPDGVPEVPQPRPSYRSGVSAGALGWGLFGLACAGAALAYAFGLWR